MKGKVYLDDLGIICSLGSGKDAVWKAISGGRARGMTTAVLYGKEMSLALIEKAAYQTSTDPRFGNRASAILNPALDEIRDAANRAIRTYGAERVAVLIGSCDNGSELSLEALADFRNTGHFPKGYVLEYQRPDLPARHAAECLGAKGPAIAYSTACASSASAIVSARNLILSGICDAAVVGGVDIVSEAVALGFSAIEAISDKPCQPFSKNRKGINLGEGAAVFLLTKDNLGGNGLRLLGVGESGDAHHMTAPDPEGKGAILAMERALKDAGLEPGDIHYINLHGTGTSLNDSMEAKAVARIFGERVPASSTKSMTGHTLGAAGALELGICALALSDRNELRILPPQIWDGIADPEIPGLDIVEKGRKAESLSVCLSNSFAFGGCNVSIAIGLENPRARKGTI